MTKDVAGKRKNDSEYMKHKSNGHKILVDHFAGEYEVGTGENLNRQ